MTARQRIAFHAVKVGDLVDLRDPLSGNTNRCRVTERTTEMREYLSTRWRSTIHVTDIVLINKHGVSYSATRPLVDGEKELDWPFRDAYETTLVLDSDEDLLRWSIRTAREGVDGLEGHPDDIRAYHDAVERLATFAEAAVDSPTVVAG